MSPGVALDASVLLKLVLEEELSERADAIVQDTLSRRESLFTPALALDEVTNALLQRTRRGGMTPDESLGALRQLLALPLKRIEPAALHEHALTFATTHQIRSAYDTIYVVTAQLLEVDLWTADLKLINALGSAAPWVRWIGDYAPSDSTESSGSL